MTEPFSSTACCFHQEPVTRKTSIGFGALIFMRDFKTARLTFAKQGVRLFQGFDQGGVNFCPIALHRSKQAVVVFETDLHRKRIT